jgi:hypothetical protein
MRIAGLAACVAVLLLSAESSAAGSPPRFATSRTVFLGAGHAVRSFTLRERGGVILLNRVTVLRGVRIVVDARIPGVAGVRVTSRSRRIAPSPSCQRHGAVDVCTQGEEWCPMPQATWQVRMVKLSGPAGRVRFDLIIAPPPNRP